MTEPALSADQTRRWFIGALSLAAAVRFYLLWQYYCISIDGVLYIRAAQDFFRGNVAAGLKSLYPPGYPLLIAAVYPWIGNWELAGQLLSLVFGVAILLPLYGLFRTAFADVKVALLACYLAAISPFLALYSAHVRSEIPYLFLAVLALYFFLTGLQRHVKARFFWGGLIGGYAFLIRPEALGFLLIVPAVVLLQWLRQRVIGLSWFTQSIGLLCFGFLLLALPYIVYLSIDTGHVGAVSRKAGLTLGLNLKKSGVLDDEDLAQFGTAESLVFSDYIRQHPWRYAKKVVSDVLPAIGVFFEALHYSYVPFLLLGLYLVLRENVWDRRDLMLLVFVLAHVFGFALILVKRRYALQAVPISLAWVALGMFWVWDELRARLSTQRARMIGVALALIFIGGTLPKTLKAVSREKAFVREAGWYLKGLNKTGSLRVAVLDERVTFYAESQTVKLNEAEAVNVAGFLREQKPDYLAVEAKSLKKTFPELARQPGKFGLVLEKTFVGSRRDRMLLFKVS
jgi:4-amino-4-deoxy-L-arabinose transferase-like glycosyltransferase